MEEDEIKYRIVQILAAVHCSLLVSQRTATSMCMFVAHSSVGVHSLLVRSVKPTLVRGVGRCFQKGVHKGTLALISTCYEI